MPARGLWDTRSEQVPTRCSCCESSPAGHQPTWPGNPENLRRTQAISRECWFVSSLPSEQLYFGFRRRAGAVPLRRVIDRTEEDQSESVPQPGPAAGPRSMQQILILQFEDGILQSGHCGRSQGQLAEHDLEQCWEGDCAAPDSGSSRPDSLTAGRNPQGSGRIGQEKSRIHAALGRFRGNGGW